MIRAICLALVSIWSALAMAGDPDFYYHATLPKGPFVGQALDNKDVRPLTLLDNTIYASLNDTPQTHYLIGGVSDHGKIFIAKIPHQGVKSVYFMRVKFGFMAYHSMIRLQMDQATPVELVAEIPTEEQFNAGEVPQRLEKPVLLKDVLLSIEGVFRPGDSFDLVKGLKDNFGLAYRMLSVEARLQQDTRSTQQFLTNFSPEEGDAIMKYFTQKSSQVGFSETYNTIKRQCTNLAMDVIRNAVPWMERDGHNLLLKAWETVWDKAWLVDSIVPSLTPYGLAIRGALTGGLTIQNGKLKLLAQTVNMENDPSLTPDFVEYARVKSGGTCNQIFR